MSARRISSNDDQPHIDGVGIQKIPVLESRGYRDFEILVRFEIQNMHVLLRDFSSFDMMLLNLKLQNIIIILFNMKQ